MRPPSPRKLLVASVGVATVSYALVACDKPPVTGNLPAPPPPPPSIPIVGNLPAPPPPPDAGAPPAAPDAGAVQTPKGK
jgi:hypothetical protein